MTEGITPLKPSLAKTPHDHLPFLGGKTIATVSDGELASALVGLGDEKAHERGRAANAEAWGKHLTKISDGAGKKAVAGFLSGSESV